MLLKCENTGLQEKSTKIIIILKITPVDTYMIYWCLLPCESNNNYKNIADLLIKSSTSKEKKRAKGEF